MAQYATKCCSETYPINASEFNCHLLLQVETYTVIIFYYFGHTSDNHFETPSSTNQIEEHFFFPRLRIIKVFLLAVTILT
jgi:hypothetical protein